MERQPEQFGTSPVNIVPLNAPIDTSNEQGLPHISKETEGCIKPGFSNRLLRANESQMDSLERLALEQFGSLIEEAGVLITKSP